MRLWVEPNTAPKTWEAFSAEAPPYSAALDGYVWGPARYDGARKVVNFNHHEDVDRLSTRATCAQVLMALRSGLFRVQNAFVNDCDEDVCLAAFLLENPHLARGTMNPSLNRLVYIEDMADTTAGTYPFPIDLPILEQVNWIFEPYRRFRLEGGLDRRDPGSFESTIVNVTGRIMRHLTGTGGSIPLNPDDFKYSIVDCGPGWALAKEVGVNTKAGIINDGYTMYGTFRDRPGGTRTYTIGKLAFAPLDLGEVKSRLNQLEGTTGADDCWGGGNTIMGSPRGSGSKLEPIVVAGVLRDLAGR